MKYGKIKRTWISIAKFLIGIWIIAGISAGLYFITNWAPFALIGGLFFILAVCFTIPTVVYNVLSTGKAVVSHKVSQHEQSKNICEICGKEGKTTWSGALRVCKECKTELEG